MPESSVSLNLIACHRCPRRQAPCSGPCVCLEDGRDILRHAEASDCPLGRHEPASSRGLGDTVARVAKATGAEAAARWFQRVTGRDCGCAARRRRLNAWWAYRD